MAETGGGLPDVVSLAPLLQLDLFDPRSVTTRWRREANHVRTPIGTTTEGVLHVDLVADGPHGLVLGATGAGKSELLRTVLTGLATTLDPHHLTFLLIDCRGSRAHSTSARGCRTRWASLPTLTTTSPSECCQSWRQSCAAASNCFAPWTQQT